jgi:hypothetical protein
MSLVTVPNLSNPSIPFTPSLAFGGGATGMTYNTRAGWYVRVGSLVFFSINIVLTAKGSSTGTAAISGLPITPSSSGFVPLSVYADTLASVTGQVGANIVASNTTIALYQFGAPTTVLTHANFNNGSNIFISGLYNV